MQFTRLYIAISVALSVSHITIAAILRRASCPGGQQVNNEACCALFPVVDLMQNQLFEGATCGEDAHSALRLAFHDAIGFSTGGGKGNGADGSILDSAFSPVETPLPGNEGIDDIVNAQAPIFAMTNLTAGDFLHLAAAVGTANCPGAPRLQFLMGRPAPTEAAAGGTVPRPEDDVDSILARFADAGFSPAEMVALLSSHTIAAADEIDTTIPGTPFDSTVGTFDSQIFLEVLLNGTMFPGTGPNPGEVASPIAGEMRLQSDFAISRDSRTACLWQNMINNQQQMVSQFAAAMAKLQVLGQDTSTLIDCSDVVPTPASIDGTIKYPPSFSQDDVQQACTETPFPSIATQAGAAPTLSPVPS